MPTIEIYPKIPKPDWVVVGATCHVAGEAQDVFTVLELGERAVLTEGGMESFTKLKQWPVPITLPQFIGMMVWTIDKAPNTLKNLRSYNDRPLPPETKYIALLPKEEKFTEFFIFEFLMNYEEFALSDGRSVFALWP